MGLFFLFCFLFFTSCRALEQPVCWAGQRRWGAASVAVQAGHWAASRAVQQEPGPWLEEGKRRQLVQGRPEKSRRGTSFRKCGEQVCHQPNDLTLNYIIVK